VGKDAAGGAEDFFVHEALICPQSDVFKNAMKESWLEAQERKVNLPEEKPEIFKPYLDLLYVSAP
jgi:hypothetical protein